MTCPGNKTTGSHFGRQPALKYETKRQKQAMVFPSAPPSSPPTQPDGPYSLPKLFPSTLSRCPSAFNPQRTTTNQPTDLEIANPRDFNRSFQRSLFHRRPHTCSYHPLSTMSSIREPSPSPVPSPIPEDRDAESSIAAGSTPTKGEATGSKNPFPPDLSLAQQQLTNPHLTEIIDWSVESKPSFPPSESL